jgi:hypothetical protein
MHTVAQIIAIKFGVSLVDEAQKDFPQPAERGASQRLEACVVQGNRVAFMLGVPAEMWDETGGTLSSLDLKPLRAALGKLKLVDVESGASKALGEVKAAFCQLEGSLQEDLDQLGACKRSETRTDPAPHYFAGLITNLHKPTPLPRFIQHQRWVVAPQTSSALSAAICTKWSPPSTFCATQSHIRVRSCLHCCLDFGRARTPLSQMRLEHH